MMMARGEDVAGANVSWVELARKNVAGVDVAVEDLVRADLVGKDAYSGIFFIDALGFEIYETVTSCVTSNFSEFEFSGVFAIKGSRIINCWKESANWAIIWKKKGFGRFIEENFWRD